LLDRKLKVRSRNKILKSEKQKIVLKPFKQIKDYNINPTESRLIISVKVPKKSVTKSNFKVVIIKLNEDINKLNLE
jgi:hypothetical protein